MGIHALLIPSESIVNVVVGINFLFLAAVGILDSNAAERFTVVRLSVTAINLCVGGLFLFRRQATGQASLREIALCLPSVLVGGIAVANAPVFDAWPLEADLAFAGGAVLAILSLLALGKNFAILPALRGVSASGPYALLRHPIYLGEMILVAACWFAGPNWITGVVALACIPLIVVRILIEERLLAQSEAYQDYKARVRWRLLPWIW